MKQKMAVTGFMLDHELKNAKSSGSNLLKIFPEADHESVYSVVQQNDIEEILTGAESKGKTVVQLILKPEASVEIVYKQQLSMKGAKLIDDPTLTRLTRAAIAKEIMR